MQVIDRGGYSREEILDVLHSKTNARNVRFRYDLLDKEGRYKKTLDSVIDGEVAMSAFSTIKRTAKFKIKEQYIPERFEDAQESASKLWSTASNWNEGTHNGTVLNSNDMRITTPALSALTDAGFETLGTGSGANAGLSTEWVHYGNPTSAPWRGTFAQSSSAGNGMYRWGQQMTRLLSGALGIQTAKTNILVLTLGQTAYVSFFFKPSNSNFTNPSYCYLMSASGNQRISDYTILDVGNGWFRFDGKYTSVTSGAINYAVMIAWNTGSDGNVWIDNVYINNGNPPTYTADWISQPIQASSGGFGSVTSSNVTYASTVEKNSKVTVYSRWSKDGSTGWSPWLVQSNNSQLRGLEVGTTQEGAWVQFKVVLDRTDIEALLAVFNSLSFTIDRNYSVLYPETTEVNYLQDRIQPFMEVKMPDNEWVEFPLGVFLLSSPTRIDGVNGAVYREIEAYDGLLILDEDKFTTRYVVRAGTRYTTAVSNILSGAGVTLYSVEESTLTLSADKEFATGMSKLEAINDLLQAINYTPVWVDSTGYFTSTPYVSPTNRAVDYTYEDNSLSVTYNGMEEELDIYSVPNIWVAVESNPDKPLPLQTRLTNADPKSQTSTVSMGRNIVDFREVDEIANIATLNAYVQRIAFEASQVFGKLKFKTALMPFHEYSDVIHVRYAPLKVNHKFSETAWRMELKAGAEMEHEARRVVDINVT